MGDLKPYAPPVAEVDPDAVPLTVPQAEAQRYAYETADEAVRGAASAALAVVALCIANLVFALKWPHPTPCPRELSVLSLIALGPACVAAVELRRFGPAGRAALVLAVLLLAGAWWSVSFLVWALMHAPPGMFALPLGMAAALSVCLPSRSHVFTRKYRQARTLTPRLRTRVSLWTPVAIFALLVELSVALTARPG